jgi:purine-binding chemotaxis protein CheW
MSSPFEQTVLGLRHAFDAAFASPPPVAAEDVIDMLLVRIAGDPYALRSRELSGLVAGRKVTPVSARRPEFLGLAGIRGAVVPVYSLVVLLGYGAPPASSRWLGLAGGKEAVGLAIQEFDGFVRVRAQDVHPVGDASARPHVREVARVGDLPRPVVDLASVLAVVNGPRSGAASIKEG